MHSPIEFKKSGAAILSAFLLVSILLAQVNPANAQTRRVRFIKAFIVDFRLSALRREADVHSQVIQRPRLGRPIYIMQSKSGGEGQPKFYRVAVTRRTRGWIHSFAIAVPGRPGEDARVMKLIDETQDGLDRITLCRLFIDHFGRSPLLPRAMFTLAEESDLAATSLTRNARKRLKSIDENGVGARDYYLSDSGLDRYSKLRIRFEFDEVANRYAYDGQAYRDIVKRFPDSNEAVRSRVRLARMEKRLARK